MQFKHPEILYFLALLIVPILVHLFQLQKFIKTPFTNVAFLQKIRLQTRKSLHLKKWLILTSRLLLFTCLILAFSQPYFSNKTTLNKPTFFIYLDNSLSTSAKGKKGELLQATIQEILESFSKEKQYNFLTNNNFYTNLTSSEFKKKLLQVKNTAKKANLNTVLLSINKEFKNRTNTLYDVLLISDFQNINNKMFTNVTRSVSLLKLESITKSNLSIDSVFINNVNDTHYTIKVLIKNQGKEKQSIPIAMYNNQNLVNKQTFSIKKDSKKYLNFSIQKTYPFLGKISLLFNDTFNFDNHFYFSINLPQKTNILSIGKQANFLSKIYTKNRFVYKHISIEKTNLSLLKKQHLVILNEIRNLSSSLIQNLIYYTKNGGHLVIVPNKNINLKSYQNFFKKLNLGSLYQKKDDTLKITRIHFKHPFFTSVFTKPVVNFQYPQTSFYHPISLKNSSGILFFENNKAFLSEIKHKKSTIYWFSSSLSRENSNFTNSPLIVPVFYNFGLKGSTNSKLFYRINQENKITISIKINNNQILKLINSKNAFIPLQEINQNNTIIRVKEYPAIAGFYHILKDKDTLQTIAFNYPKEENNLLFADVQQLKKVNKNIKISESIKDFFEETQQKNEVNWLWKWFLTGAIVSLLLEIFILKFLKS